MRDVWVVMAAVRPGDADLRVVGVFSNGKKATEHLASVVRQGRDGYVGRWAIDSPDALDADA